MNITDDIIKSFILKVMEHSEVGLASLHSKPMHPTEASMYERNAAEDDFTSVNLREEFEVPNPINEVEYKRLKEKTPARLGLYRAGPRYTTKTMLRLRADHAAAIDAVFSDVDESVLKECGLFTVQTMCSSRDEHLTRPDLGRKFDASTIALLKSKCKANPTVQLYAADGLSSSALSANLSEILPAILQGLKSYGIDSGTSFFVKFGRVAAMDMVTEALGATVTVVLIGERPGLATAESMSAYMTYKGTVGMPEANRTALSNIHCGGTPVVEAGAHIAYVISEMLKQKTSGLGLKI